MSCWGCSHRRLLRLVVWADWCQGRCRCSGCCGFCCRRLRCRVVWSHDARGEGADRSSSGWSSASLDPSQSSRPCSSSATSFHFQPNSSADLSMVAEPNGSITRRWGWREPKVSAGTQQACYILWCWTHQVRSSSSNITICRTWSNKYAGNLFPNASHPQWTTQVLERRISCKVRLSVNFRILFDFCCIIYTGQLFTLLIVWCLSRVLMLGVFLYVNKMGRN
jgi:hypothetical protein